MGRTGIERQRAGCCFSRQYINCATFCVQFHKSLDRLQLILNFIGYRQGFWEQEAFIHVFFLSTRCFSKLASAGRRYAISTLTHSTEVRLLQDPCSNPTTVCFIRHYDDIVILGKREVAQ